MYIKQQCNYSINLFKFILLLICPLTLPAQLKTITGESILLQEHIEPSIQYTSKNFINLKDGFRVVGGRGIARSVLNINPNVNVLPQPPLSDGFVSYNGPYITNNSLEVGAITGEFSVSPTGQANYVIPIDLPKGAGIMPNMSISYTSQLYEGMLGLSWTLNGVSQINRGDNVPFYDGNSNKFNFKSTDALYLNGTRLIVTQGNNSSWENINELRPANDPKIIVIPVVDDNDIKGFTVYESDGKVYEYGGNDATVATPKGALSWKLKRVEDNFSNYMQFTYITTYTETDGSQSRLSKISYSGNSDNGMSTSNEVFFFYKKKPSFNVNINRNYLQSSPFLLEKIVSLSQGQKVWGYKFEYAYSPNAVFQYRLHNIWKSNRNDEMLNPTQINWNIPDSNGKIELANSTKLGIETLRCKPMGLTVSMGDFDNDGSESFIVSADSCENGNFFETRLFNFNNSGNNPDPSSKSFDMHLPYRKLSFLQLDSGRREILRLSSPVDFNGDGKLDFAVDILDISKGTVIKNGDTTVTVTRKVETTLLTATSVEFRPINPFNTSTMYLSSEADYPIDTSKNVSDITADFNDDGYDELLSINLEDVILDGVYSYKYKLHHRSVVNGITNLSSSEISIDAITFGDGIDKNKPTISVGDFNSDGKPDLFIYVGKVLSVFEYNVENQNFDEIFRSSNSFNLQNTGKNLIFIDYNTDGLTDVLINNHIINRLELYLSTGNGGFAEPLYFSNLNFGDLNNAEEGFETLKISDVNYDGKPDFINLRRGNSQYIEVFFNNGFIVSNGQLKLDFKYIDFDINVLSPVNDGNRVQYFVGDIIGDGSFSILFNEENVGVTILNYGNFFQNHYVKSIENAMLQNIDLSFKKLSFAHNNATQHIFGNTQNIFQINGLKVLPRNTLVLDNALLPINKGVRPSTGYSYADRLYSHIYGSTFDQNTYSYGLRNKRYDFKVDIDTTNKSIYLAESTVSDNRTNPLDILSSTNYFKPVVYSSSLNPKIRIIYSPRSTTTDHKRSVSKTESIQLNEWGNVTRQSTEVIGSNAFTSKVFNYNYFITKRGVPAYPTKTVIAKQRSGQDALFTSQTSMYSTNGELQSTENSGIVPILGVNDINSPAISSILENYAFTTLNTQNIYYDIWGNTSKSEIVHDNQTTTTRYEYEPLGRFINKTYNNKDNTVSYQRQALTGAVMQTTDINGINITMQRNAWDRVISTQNPDSSTTSSQLLWGEGDILFIERQSASGTEDVENLYFRDNATIKTRSKNYANKNLIRTVSENYRPSSRLYEMEMNSIAFEDFTDNYDNYGALETFPENEGYTTIEYDVLNRPTKTLSSRKLGFNLSVETTKTNTYTGRTISQYLSSTTGKNPKSKSTIFNALGEPIAYFDEDGQEAVNVFYDSFGRINKRSLGDREIIYTYDVRGNLIKEEDAQAGTTNYSYDNLDRLISHDDYRGLEISTTYDELDRPTQVTSNTGNIKYSYDGQHKQSLDKVEIGEDLKTEYEYDELTRPTKITETYKGESTSQNLQYDSIGRNHKISLNPTINLQYQYYSNGQVKNILLNNQVKLSMEHYDPTGQLKVVKFGNGQVMERYLANNTEGIINNYTNVDLSRSSNPANRVDLDKLMVSDLVLRDKEENVDPNDYYYTSLFKERILTETHTGNILQRQYFLNPETGDDWDPSLKETFIYDEYDRLTNIYGTATTDTMVYDQFGNITYNSRFGEFSYPDLDILAPTNYQSQKPDKLILKPNAVYPYQLPKQNIVYNAMGLPTEIKLLDQDGNVTYSTFITYDATGMRRTLKHYRDGELLSSKKYYKDHVSIQNKNQEAKSYYPISHQGTMLMMLVQSSAGIEVLYTVQDYLGSIRLVLNEAGDVVNEYSFDAWGRPRNTDTWENISFDDVNYLAGMAYTGQEYLEHTQLYHYNGRLYDPISCRMLSPDKIVANPRNGQNYNRYAYVLNNPLKYTDPSGWQVYQPQKPSDVVGSNFTNWDLSGFGLYQDPSGIIQDYATALQTSRGGSSFGTTISNARVTFTNPNYDNDFGSELLSLVKNFSQYLEYKYNVSGSTSGEPGLTQVGDKQFEFNKEVNIVAERKIAESDQNSGGSNWATFAIPVTMPGISISISTVSLMSALSVLAIPFALNGDTRTDKDNSPTYFHYTNKEGLSGILSNNTILPNSKGKTYYSSTRFSPAEAFNNLFLQQPTHFGRGDYVVKFKLTSYQRAQSTYDISSPYELIYPGALRIQPGNLLYGGPNLFK